MGGIHLISAADSRAALRAVALAGDAQTVSQRVSSDSAGLEPRAPDGETLAALCRRLDAQFVVPEGVNRPLAEFETGLDRFLNPYREIGIAFIANIRGLFSTVTIPYSLAHASSLDRHYQRIFSAERIRSLMRGGAQDETEADLEARRARVAQEQADAKMETFLGSREGSEALIRDVCHFLLRAAKSQPFALAAEELLLQGVVLCWGAFEVLARDVFVSVLNQTPSYVDRLINHPAAKRRFELARLPVNTLLAHGFNLSTKMGTLLAEQQDLSDLNSLKAVFEALCPDAVTLRSSLDSRDLRILALRRNLVVHRRAVIDEAFAKATGCVERPGDRIRVSPDSLEKHIGSVTDSAAELFRVIGPPSSAGAG